MNYENKKDCYESELIYGDTTKNLSIGLFYLFFPILKDAKA